MLCAMQSSTPNPAHVQARARWRRWLRPFAWTLLALYLGYLLAGNVFLNTALGPWSVNRKPAKFQMHWERGLTWFPGEVVLWNVRLRGHVGHTVWKANAGRVGGHIALLALAGKRLSVPRVVADQVTGRVETVVGDMPPPLPRPGGWTLWFPSIRSDSIRGGFIGGLQVDGHGSAEVGFRKVLRGGQAELLPSHARFEQADLRWKGQTVLGQGTLDARFAMAANSRDQARGLEKLRFFSAEVDVAGAVPGLRARPGDAGGLVLQAVPGSGRVQGRLALEHARLAAGGVLSARVPVAFEAADGTGHTDVLTLQLAVDDDLHLKADLPGRDGTLAVHADLRLAGNALQVAQPRLLLPRTSGTLSGRWQVGSLGWLVGMFVDVPWLSLEGTGTLEAALALDHGVLQAGSRLSIPQVHARADILGQHVRGSGSAQARLEPGPDGALRSVFDVALDDYRVAAGDAPGRPFVTGSDLRLHGSSSPDLAQARNTLQATATFRDAKVPDLRAYNRFLPNAQLRFEGGSGSLDGAVSLDAAGAAADGRLRARGRGAAVGISGVPLQGDLDIDLRLRRADLQALAFDIGESTVGLSNVRLRQADGQWQQGWWGRLRLPAMRLSMAQGRAAVDGSMQASMRDIGLLLDLYAQRKAFPAWIGHVVDAGQARLDARLRWREDLLVLDDVQASNARFDLDGRLRLRGRTPQGVLYARWGVLGLGMDVQGGEHQLHLAGARAWFDAQPRYLP